LQGIDQRGGDAVDAAAVVVLAVEAVTVEDLHLVAALDVDAAVAASLTLGLGQVGYAELDVEVEAASEFLLGNDVALVHLHDAARQ
jgi:hypothetical protein